MFIVICKFRDNLPSSFLDATFGERLFKPKHILQKVYAFSQSSLYPSGYNHFYDRFPKLQSNTLKLGKIVY